MYIQPNYNNVNMYGSKNKPDFWKRFKQKIFDALPDATFNDTKGKADKLNRFSDRISRPAENRLIMGATALLSQPTIDYYNKKVDEDTRTIARNRTLAKIIVGTLVGIAVRGSSYKLVEKMTNIKGNKAYSKALLPPKYLKQLLDDKVLLDNYRSAISTSLAILAMCYTNFAIDAPLTVFLTNYLNEETKEKQNKIDKERGILA
ncbi:hypothetical protein IJ384_01845 [bacterium]|nr:hypothetical protein [bacterium]